MDSVQSGSRTFLTIANLSNLTELNNLRQRNIDFHKPWVYHGNTDTYLEKIASGRTISLLLWTSPSTSLIGVINLNEPVMGALQSAYLGYFIDERFAGQGYMSEGLRLALDHAFSKLGFHRLEANIQPGNTSSIALVKRLGFRLEGFSPKYLKINDHWCDHERWAILADERVRVKTIESYV
ncbi:MAG: GNAT family protein [Candidatus Obscuribacterales bacterium]|nr:GNAT family protein [Candidatus Obscuribacterales bacterium]